MATVDGRHRPASSDWCPASIGLLSGLRRTAVRNQSDSLSAFIEMRRITPRIAAEDVEKVCFSAREARPSPPFCTFCVSWGPNWCSPVATMSRVLSRRSVPSSASSSAQPRTGRRVKPGSCTSSRRASADPDRAQAGVKKSLAVGDNGAPNMRGIPSMHPVSRLLNCSIRRSCRGVRPNVSSTMPRFAPRKSAAYLLIVWPSLHSPPI